MLEKLDERSVKKAVIDIITPYDRGKVKGEKVDETCFYEDNGHFPDLCLSYAAFPTDKIAGSVARSLMENKYWVCNQVNKYYVIAFAIDFTCIEIYSKDCDKKIIKWRDNDADDEISGVYSDSEKNDFVF